ncbi:MAG TPA: polyribonucleotide nucleotidyltransferase [Candidatus Omnitrophica bacterium]|nr:MAG: polyribonucleotide nucleotidyltransferase [Omnitrophica WOR_2 bacterium GWA2_63_20]OGX16944.1 MAG: polyribonucleotide nucleotidyltransferase [Omnitrophica WOR_2 bacterium GWF2_63_9]OGX31850.1 MAG: polyribonucleotide nucleotidyltransferase [Omnitrophica WOR_2 bacterium RIFCSPHIGHO2_12_FULL_64_13]OGX36056.1 MAG: polyribonucleotide nucleotidyltransferase [Omnitrophica WOR_2 bacterium RIFCSPHIGHO2_02_FULL_63_39]OGX44129.1 MAG: polyribonucleotide nucleotidyltransferase [Omnitrophica WOR_2 ba
MAQRASTSLGSTTFSLETGKVAKQADGSVVVQQGDTVVLVTAVYAPFPKPATLGDVVPLMVDYREKTYAAGRIPGGFFKREGRPTEREILTARLIDRPIRPLFPHGFLHDIQLMAMVLSSDGQYDPDVLAIVGASAALHISPLPFPKPVGAVRVGSVKGQLVVNPTYQQLTDSPIDLVVAGTSDGVLSIEAGFLEVPESNAIEAIRFGYEHVRRLIRLQEELGAAVNRPKAGNLIVREPSAQLVGAIRQRAVEELRRSNQLAGKDAREHAVEMLREALVQEFAPEGGPVSSAEVNLALGVVERDEVRRHILTQQRRIDGRRLTDLREIQCEVGVLPRTHGSSLFTRGETQSLAVTTLGTSDDEQMIEALEGESYKRFMLHYNFPPFSVGEVRPVRGPGRREIGHGALAERALAPMIPTKEDFPYTIRVVSDILESNGSSSMATVCSGSLSLMDAGVPIRAAVSGVAMGLVKEGDQAAILTDISGLEDHLGDMDFKVAGSRKGLTALQVDVKLPAGLTIDLIERIVAQSHPARLAVLDLMTKALETPRPAISVYAPRIVTIKINPDRIRDVIGPGGRTIRKIIEETGATINVEDDGSVSVASADSHKSERALEIIRSLTEEVEVGRIYTGKVKRIMNFGAFCEILPGKEGLIHVSELAEGFVKKVDDVVKIGDEVKVKVIEIDEQGRVNLSRKRVLADEHESAAPVPQVSSRQKGPSDDA